MLVDGLILCVFADGGFYAFLEDSADRVDEIDFGSVDHSGEYRHIGVLVFCLSYLELHVIEVIAVDVYT